MAKEKLTPINVNNPFSILQIYRQAIKNVPILKYSWVLIATVCILAFAAYFKLENKSVFIYALGVILIAFVAFAFSFLTKVNDPFVKILLYALVTSIVIVCCAAVLGLGSFIFLQKPDFYKRWFPDLSPVQIDTTTQTEKCSELVVKMAYKQILGESPNQNELREEADALESKNSTTKDLVRKLAHSDTFKQKFLSNGTAEGINQIFYKLLGNHSYLRPEHPAIKLAQEIGWDAYIDGVIDDPQKEYVDKWGNDKVPRDLHGPPRPDPPCK